MWNFFFLMHLFLLNLKVYTVAIFENSQRIKPEKGNSIHIHLWLHMLLSSAFIVVIVQSLSPVWFFPTLSTAACQASLSFTISRSLLKFKSRVNDAIWPSYPLLLPSFPFSISQHQGLFIMASQINWEGFHFKWVCIRQKIFCPYACETECIWN